MTKAALITMLENTKNQTLAFYDLPKEDLKKRYASNKWNILKIVHHLADSESVLNERIKRIIAEPKQVIWAFKQDLWCSKLDYNTFPLEISKASFLANRNSTLYLVDHFYEKFSERVFVHSETGLRTLKEEFEKVAIHNQGHLNQIQIALSNNNTL